MIDLHVSLQNWVQMSLKMFFSKRFGNFILSVVLYPAPATYFNTDLDLFYFVKSY